MISPDEARELAARRWYTDVSEMEIEEFDLGYVAWSREPEPDDPTVPPSTVGGTLLVIDKETGEISSWPDRGSTKVIEQYRKAKSGGQS